MHVKFWQILSKFRLQPVMIPVCTGISYIISCSYEPKQEFWKSHSVSVPVFGRIICFRSYPTLTRWLIIVYSPSTTPSLEWTQSTKWKHESKSRLESSSSRKKLHISWNFFRYLSQWSFPVSGNEIRDFLNEDLPYHGKYKYKVCQKIKQN